MTSRRHSMPSYTRSTGCPTWNFSIVICKHPLSGKFLVVEETDGRGWWIPGGWVDPGESFLDAALRETREEAGIDVELDGILSIQHSHSMTHAKIRVVFLAHPVNVDQVPKSIADSESMQATWMSIDEFENIKNKRGEELIQWATYLERGGAVYPLSLLELDIR